MTSSGDILHTDPPSSGERPSYSERFKETFKEHIRKNLIGETYLPAGMLSGVLSQETIKNILLETELERSQVNELSQSILPGAVKVFTILLLIGRLERILYFIEDDQLQPSTLDQKLPLPLEKVLSHLDDEVAAAQFYKQQWAFTAPVFSRSSLPRVLEKKTVMPFIDSKSEGEGGFGEVHRILIDPSHHTFAHSSRHWFIRKELKADVATQHDYELELRNLSTLRLMKHPYLVDLLACFTYRDRYNFIFPLAIGGSLADMFLGRRPSPFEAFEETFLAFSGIVSAVRAVHDGFADGVEVIGCHRDLKPSNILLNGKTMLLADFGLSRFKQPEEGSASYFRAGRGDYLAPECEDLDGLFKKHVIHRSSDIWSLGCILSELLVFMLAGTSGIEMFRSSREFKRDGCVYYRFHQGRDTLNPGVWDHLKAFQSSGTEHARSVLSVVEKLLVLNPEERPRISVVDAYLRRFCIETLSEQITDMYGQLCEEKSLIPALVEMQRFRSWHMEVRDTNHASASSFLSAKTHEAFANVMESLKELRQTLNVIIIEPKPRQSQTYLLLRKINDVLYDALPEEWVESGKTRFECLMLQSEDTAHLFELSEALARNSIQAVGRISQLAAVKRLNLLVDMHKQNSNSCINRLDFDDIEKKGWLEQNYLGWVKQAKGNPIKQSVIIELKNYDDHYSIAEIASQLFARLEAVVSLLNAAQYLRVLPCLGYYHDPSSYSLGLVYKCPIAHETGKSTVNTLHAILEKAVEKRGSKRPSLGHRFQLACSLASSVLEFHKVGWVQKAVSALNIIFFKPSDASWKRHMTEPYFLGYLNSREDGKGVFTEGPTDDERLRRYLSPEYLHNQRYKHHFDYYSLGLVLLEVGHWRTLDNIVGDLGKSPEELRAWLLNVAVPKLDQMMGSIYERVVGNCLRWQPEFEGQEKGIPSAECLRFSELVVGELALCRA
ncbi:hypothetical protein PV08_08799 [Exophiala spinifera]|uniref:Protein kinase domain-containing protein n=1 Tax=Exophiala spinifera TaxID=91928 RepID=A0A0D2BQZ6_9EURO|nr:uncharacterized protein PV08_08799 [Exophiala spinifera]KIW13609.1 hypothetical protein PV08_08799 [Exophiala spinifera]